MVTLVILGIIAVSLPLFMSAKSNFYVGRGQALYERGRYDEALVSLENAIKILPKHGRANYYLALTYEKLGKKDDAIKSLEAYFGKTQKKPFYFQNFKGKRYGSKNKEYIGKCKDLLSQLKQ